MKSDERVVIFDTTLRDGQQCPGAGLSFSQNLEYAALAAEAGIDVLEAGFPSASRLDFEIVRAIADQLSGKSSSPMIIAALCQLRSEQVDKTMEALEPCLPNKKGRVHIYLPVDPHLMAASLGDDSEDHASLLKNTHSFCKRAFSSGFEVEFSPEGYSRQGENFDFVTDLIRAAIEGGASIINCPDTIGGAAWLQGESYFVELMKRHSEIVTKEFPARSITWSAHCHNDFGLALHNSLQAVFFGPARQVEGCMNGIGERAGNASLEQCIMAITHFGKAPTLPTTFTTGVKTELIQKLSDFVAESMLPRQPHWPISGENAARHSSGGHTNAILRDPLAYQPFDPKETGKAISFSFGPLSGGNHVKSIVEEAGYICNDDEKAPIAQFVKDFYATRRKGVTDAEVVTAYIEYRKPIDIKSFGYAKRHNRCEVELQGRFFGEEGEIQEIMESEDSALAVLKNAIWRHLPTIQFVSYRSDAVGDGVSAASVTSIGIVDDKGKHFAGRGSDRDIEISAMRALIDAVNQAYVHKMFKREVA